MDISKLSRGQLIAGVGGALLIVSLFLSWVSLVGASASAFDAFSGMDIIMLVIGIAAVAVAALAASGANVEVPANSAVILAVLGVLIVGWALGWVLEEPSAGFGAWLGLIAAGAIAYGGWEAYRKPAPMAAMRPATGGQQPPAQSATAQPASPPPADAPDATREQTPPTPGAAGSSEPGGV